MAKSLITQGGSEFMNHIFDFDVSARYQLLCRASQSNLEHQHHRLELLKDLGELTHMIEHDLPALARQGSPDDFADILRAMTLELEIFREFCEFPDLAQKVVVGIGGAFSAGKSSLINTILGKKRLVVEVDPTTSLPTYLLYGQQEQITALNLFQRRVELSSEEFASLTHEEQAKYGSQVAGLLQSAFISDPEFPWHNLALLDTPGYSKPEHEDSSERTDEHVARVQLNSAQFIIWVVSAAGGVISEDDLVFLASLNPAIPKLVVLSRADSKPESDIQQIVVLIKKTLCDRAIQVLDVIPTSARKKRDYPIDAVQAFLNDWNVTPRQLSFAQNFKSEFTKYHRFLQREQAKVSDQIGHLNKIMVLADEYGVQSHALALRKKIYDESTLYDLLAENLRQLEDDFFKKFNSISVKLSVEVEDFVVAADAIKNPDCSPELLARFANTADSDLLELIVAHINCPVAVLAKQLDHPVNLAVLTAACLNPNTPQDKIIKHLNQLDWATKRKIAQSSTHSKLQEELAMLKNQFIDFELALREPTDTRVLDVLSATENLSAKLVLAKNTNLSVFAQQNILHNSNRDIQLELAKNKQVDKSLFRVSPSEEAKQIAIAQGDDYDWDYLAKSTFCSPAAQLILVKEADGYICSILAENPCCTEDAQLLILSKEVDNHYSYIHTALAENPCCTESVQLALLSKCENDSSLRFVGSTLAKNPNITKKAQAKIKDNWLLLMSLATNFNIDVSIQIEIATEPFLQIASLHELVENPACAPEVQKIIAKRYDSDDYLRSLATNKNCLASIQIEIAESNDEPAKLNLIKNKNITIEAQNILLKDEKTSWSILRELLEHQHITEKVKVVARQKIESIFDYIQSLNSAPNWVLCGLAESEKIDQNTQLAIHFRGDINAKIILAANPICSSVTQKLLCPDIDADWGIQRALATNPNCDADIQKILIANSKDLDALLGLLVENPACITDIQKVALSHKDQWWIRRNLAENPNIKEDCQLILAKDAKEDVRKSLARNPSCTEKVQLILSKDTERYVYQALAENKNCTETAQFYLATHSDDYVRQRLAKNQGCLLSVQKILAKDTERNVRAALARNEKCHVDILLLLASDRERYVRDEVAENKLCSLKIQKILLNDAEDYVRHYLAKNKNCFLEIQLQLAKSKDDGTRTALASNTSISLDAQNILAQDKQFSVRWALFNNPNCSKEALNMLMAIDQ